MFAIQVYYHFPILVYLFALSQSFRELTMGIFML